MVFHKLLSEPLELCVLKLSDLRSPPAVRGPDHGRIHPLQNRMLSEQAACSSHPASRFTEESFQQIRRPDRPSMCRRAVQMGDTGFEVFLETTDRRGILLLISIDQVFSEDSGHRHLRSFIGHFGSLFERNRDLSSRKLVHQVAHPMSQAVLSQQ